MQHIIVNQSEVIPVIPMGVDNANDNYSELNLSEVVIVAIDRDVGGGS